MFGFGSSDARAVLNAMSASQAVIEFKPDGTILTANDNFCRALGYDLAEIVGKHHRIFVDQLGYVDKRRQPQPCGCQA